MKMLLRIKLDLNILLNILECVILFVFNIYCSMQCIDIAIIAVLFNVLFTVCIAVSFNVLECYEYITLFTDQCTILYYCIYCCIIQCTGVFSIYCFID